MGGEINETESAYGHRFIFRSGDESDERFSSGLPAHSADVERGSHEWSLMWGVLIQMCGSSDGWQYMGTWSDDGEAWVHEFRHRGDAERPREVVEVHASPDFCSLGARLLRGGLHA